MKTCLIIPVYNHEQAIPLVVTLLKKFEIPCFLVDDGSSASCAEVLMQLARQEASWLTLHTRKVNGGKGAAVLDGFALAYAQGFTHAIQVDADGQHDLADIPVFIAASQKQPNAMILGQPQFDASAPKSRLYGRRITNFWIMINTLSCAIADGMCGFRLYPLAPVAELNRHTKIAEHMDFDVDIVVRLYWQGVAAVNIPTAVTYPLDGVSHFNVVKDNLYLSKTHAKHFFGMLRRIPQLFCRQYERQ